MSKKIKIAKKTIKTIKKIVNNTKPRILFYDIETTPLRAWVWGLGEQVIRHGQLDPEHSQYSIICISYCWNDGKPAKVMSWLDHTTEEMITAFDKIVKTADVVIGKNNTKFDDKRINTLRLLQGLEPLPKWIGSTDDLEKQLRRHFTFPSHSLDFLSKAFGFGGKDKMEFQDWIDIVDWETDVQKSMKALKKMIKYVKKDAEHTRGLYNKVEKYIEPKLNVSKLKQEHVCITCGSRNLKKNGTRLAGNTIFQEYFCNEHGGYAGRVSIKNKQKEPILNK